MTKQTSRPILVVEDSDEDFDTVREAFVKSGMTCELRRVTSGAMCLDLLRGEGDATVRPALVLMDLNMPGIDGREVLQTVKSDPALKDLPIVVLTSSSNSADLDFCYKAGANAYHIKPVRYTAHLDVIQAVFDYWLENVVLPDQEAGRK